ncbi:MAG: serine/threonine-protein kinase [Polyangiales bacterium]
MIPPGVTLDERYRVVRLLGEGAMGAVYEAEHVVIGRRVAVKVLHARFTRSPEAVSRFTREARAAAAIGHPHIVSVTDFGTHGQQPFLVMELLRGETLGERIAKSPAVPYQEACVIMGQVLSALDAAHAIGVVHRDLKPENVFVREERATSVKLLDFGVSKFHPPGGREQHITKDGLLVGTPNYMAPEQWTGQRDIDCRADLFAAGVMFFELLTGGLPYEGADERELFEEVVRGVHAPPSPSEIAPGVPPALDAVVLKAVERERERRYQTAQEFLDALRPFGAAAEIHRAPPGAIPSPDITQRALARTPIPLSATIPAVVEARASRPVSRPARGRYVAVVAALLTLTAGVFAGVLLVRPTREPPRIAPRVAQAPLRTEAARVEAAPPAAPPTTPPTDAPAVSAAVTERQHHHRTRAPRAPTRRRGMSMSREF